MAQDVSKMSDLVSASAGYGRPQGCSSGIAGVVSYRLVGPDGVVKCDGVVSNLVTQVGDQWYGERAAGVTKSAVNISNVTNSTTSTVTTSSAHGFGVGDPVTISGVGGATDANGSWVVASVPSTTTFTLTFNKAPGNYTSGGSVVGRSLPPVTGMRLGTGTTAVSKTGSGAAIGTYVTGSSHVLDSVPASTLSGSSRRISYVVTWAAGEGTSNGISEVVLSFEAPLSNSAGAASDTVARALLSPVVNKGSADTLLVTWTHDLLGA